MFGEMELSECRERAIMRASGQLMGLGRRIPGRTWTGERGAGGAARRQLLDALALGHGVLHALVERGLLVAAAVADGQLRLQLRLQRRALRLQLRQPRLRQGVRRC